MKYSEHIDAFLTFLRDAEYWHSCGCADEDEANRKTQDILHSLELDEHDGTELAVLAGAIKGIREERRAAKDKRMQLQPVVEWTAENKPVINKLEQLLGKVRKIENSTESRHYNPKTDIVKKGAGKRGFGT